MSRGSVRPHSTPCARNSALFALFVGMLLDPHADAGAQPPVPAPPATEEEAAERYVSNLRRLLETRVIPDLRRGIVSVAHSKPTSLAVDVTDDPSFYAIGAKRNADGSVSVRLSLGYLAVHDAALDAVALSDVLDRPDDLRRYLVYQLQLAHENQSRRSRGEGTQRAMTFGEFVGLSAKETQAIFARPDWRAARDAVESESLIWVLSHLLARADPGLAGMTSSQAARNGDGAARLVAATGWFPVPPVATALGMAEVERSPALRFKGRVLLCRAARLMAAGVVGFRDSASWQSKLNVDPELKERLDHIETQIAGMRRTGRCGAGGTLTAQTESSVPQDHPVRSVFASSYSGGQQPCFIKSQDS